MFTSRVCLIFTDLCRVWRYRITSSFDVLLLNLHPECIRSVKNREGFDSALSWMWPMAWCMKSSILVTTCRRIDSNSVFHICKKIRFATSGEYFASSSWWICKINKHHLQQFWACPLKEEPLRSSCITQKLNAPTCAVAKHGGSHQSSFVSFWKSLQKVTMPLCKVFSPLSFFLSVIIDLYHIMSYLYCGNGSVAKPAGPIWL